MFSQNHHKRIDHAERDTEQDSEQDAIHNRDLNPASSVDLPYIQTRELLAALMEAEEALETAPLGRMKASVEGESAAFFAVNSGQASLSSSKDFVFGLLPKILVMAVIGQCRIFGEQGEPGLPVNRI